MAKHTLSLEVPDTLNKCLMRIMDTSIYDPLTTPTCLLLQITPPGFKLPIAFVEPEISAGFTLNITSCSLGIQTSNCGTSFADLQDGIYIIKYSVSPNDYVYVEYNHLRITKALNKIQAIYCDLDLGTCDPPTEKKQKLNQIRLIQQYLSAAKAKVEYCQEPTKGMDLYRYAMKLLDKMTCSTC